jgi:polycystin 2
VNSDQQIDFIEWRNNLRAKGYADIEIETLFAKYDLDGDKILNAEEQKNMMKDLAEQNEELKDAIAELEEQAEEYLKEKKISL